MAGKITYKIAIKQLLMSRNVREADTGLADSLRQHGQLEPILVYSLKNGSYVIKDGHRRFLAAKSLGWDELDAVSVDPPTDDAELLVHQVVINDQRNGLTYLAHGRAYARLRDEFGWKQNRIAAAFGVSEPDVCLALKALNAVPAIQQALESGRIKPSAVEPLLTLPLEEQQVLAPAALRAHTTRKVRALIEAHRLCRILGDQEAVQTAVDEIDPDEIMAVEELDMALKRLRSAAGVKIQHPDLVERAKQIMMEIKNVTKQVVLA